MVILSTLFLSLQRLQGRQMVGGMLHECSRDPMFPAGASVIATSSYGPLIIMSVYLHKAIPTRAPSSSIGRTNELRAFRVPSFDSLPQVSWSTRHYVLIVCRFSVLAGILYVMYVVRLDALKVNIHGCQLKWSHTRISIVFFSGVLINK